MEKYKVKASYHVHELEKLPQPKLDKVQIVERAFLFGTPVVMLLVAALGSILGW